MKKRWLALTSYFHNRSENAIKNRFHLLISNIKKVNEKNIGKNQENLLHEMLEIFEKNYPNLEGISLSKNISQTVQDENFEKEVLKTLKVKKERKQFEDGLKIEFNAK